MKKITSQYPFLLKFKNYLFTFWIVVAMVGGLLFPHAFTHWGNFDLTNKLVMLIVVQAVMFGMGSQMSLKDLTGIRKMGKPVIVGMISQFTVMPLVGFGLAKVFNFPPEIAAGMILIGSCSSGLASNVMSYMAKANLPLSITMTTIATLAAPIMTPLLMKLLAGTYVKVSFMNMFVQIVKIVVVPIGAAMLADSFYHGSKRVKNIINYTSLLAALWLILNLFDFKVMTVSFSPATHTVIVLFNFICGAIVFGRLYYFISLKFSVIKKWMPKISMFGIVYFTAVTTAASSANILTIGVWIFIAAILHNSFGYLLGYNISRLLGIDKISSRTIALEVGMQNGAMASGLAGVLGKLSTMGLAAAIFSPWMNISGSILANYWKKRPGTESKTELNE